MKQIKVVLVMLLLSTVLIASACAESSSEYALSEGGYWTTQRMLPGVMPLYDYTNSITASLSFSNGKANCFGSITPTSDDDVSISVSLYKQNGSKWNYIASWTGSSSAGRSACASGNASVDRGTYKVVVKGNVGGKEYPTKSNTKTY